MSSTDDLPVPPVTSRRSLYFDTGDDLYVGGVPAHAYNTLPGDVRSRDGFRGCVTSLRLDGSQPINLLEHPFGIPEQYRRHREPGCLDDESRSLTRSQDYGVANLPIDPFHNFMRACA